MERVAGELGHGREFAVQLIGEVLSLLHNGVEAVLLAVVDAQRLATEASEQRNHHGIAHYNETGLVVSHPTYVPTSAHFQAMFYLRYHVFCGVALQRIVSKRNRGRKSKQVCRSCTSLRFG